MLCMVNFTTANIYNVHEHARDIYSSRFGTDGCLRSSLEVLKTDRTFWILLLTLAKLK